MRKIKELLFRIIFIIYKCCVKLIISPLNLANSNGFNIIFDTSEKQITGIFYYELIIEHYPKLIHTNIKIKLGEDVVLFLKKLFEIIANMTLIDHLDIQNKKSIFTTICKRQF